MIPPSEARDKRKQYHYQVSRRPSRVDRFHHRVSSLLQALDEYLTITRVTRRAGRLARIHLAGQWVFGPGFALLVEGNGGVDRIGKVPVYTSEKCIIKSVLVVGHT